MPTESVIIGVRNRETYEFECKFKKKKKRKSIDDRSSSKLNVLVPRSRCNFAFFFVFSRHDNDVVMYARTVEKRQTVSRDYYRYYFIRKHRFYQRSLNGSLARSVLTRRARTKNYVSPYVLRVSSLNRFTNSP